MEGARRVGEEGSLFSLGLTISKSKADWIAFMPQPYIEQAAKDKARAEEEKANYDVWTFYIQRRVLHSLTFFALC